MRTKKLYVRGDYYLGFDHRADGTLKSKNLYIYFYDPKRGGYRSRSSGTSEIEEAKRELDRLYDQQVLGHKYCPTCGQAFAGEPSPLLADAISEYLDAKSYAAAGPRLALVLGFLTAGNLEATRCDEVTQGWIESFRQWAVQEPIISPTGRLRPRKLGTVENSVSQLRSAINFALESRKRSERAEFTVKRSKEVSKTPWFRLDEEQLAATFRYALVLDPPENATLKQIEKWKRNRTNLLQYLRLGVATWARPDALHQFSTGPEKKQWNPENGYIDLNPAGRAQTKKYRPLVRAPRQLIPLLQTNDGPFVKAASVRRAFEQMIETLALPKDGQSGTKLIRRSVSNLLRPKLEGQGHWFTQGRVMLGHVRPNESDKYADPYHVEYLSTVLAEIESLIDRLELAAPGAFSRLEG